MRTYTCKIRRTSTYVLRTTISRRKGNGNSVCVESVGCETRERGAGRMRTAAARLRRRREEPVSSRVCSSAPRSFWQRALSVALSAEGADTLCWQKSACRRRVRQQGPRVCPSPVGKLQRLLPPQAFRALCTVVHWLHSLDLLPALRIGSGRALGRRCRRLGLDCSPTTCVCIQSNTCNNVRRTFPASGLRPGHYSYIYGVL